MTGGLSSVCSFTDPRRCGCLFAMSRLTPNQLGLNWIYGYAFCRGNKGQKVNLRLVLIWRGLLLGAPALVEPEFYSMTHV